MNHDYYFLNSQRLLLFFIFINLSFFRSQTNSFQIGIFDPPVMKANFTAVPADYNNDGYADVAVKTSGGSWLIDYADPNSTNNGFGSWDKIYHEYGGDDAIPVPGDYDGDGKLDLAVKTESGLWLIDLAKNGLGGWDLNLTSAIYGGVTSHPVPGYYNDDSAMDIAVKTDDGFWRIDYADSSAPNNGFGSWDSEFSQYGGSDAHPVPADYNGDGFTDLAVKTDIGGWLIDYAVPTDPNNGFGGWETVISTTWLADAVPVPGDYNGDGLADFSVKTNDGRWIIDFANVNLPDNGFGDSVIVYNQYGDADAYPVTADYDGDGFSDLSIKSTSTGTWLIDKSTTGFGGWDDYSYLGDHTNYNDLLGLSTPYYYNDLIKFQKVKDAHIDFLISPNIMFSEHNYSKIYAYLKLAKEQSLKVLLSSSNIASYQNPDNLSAYKQEFLARFKYNFPSELNGSIMGVFLGDEPVDNQYDNVEKWTSFFRSNFPEKPLYYNLMPRYWQDGNLSYDSFYENYLDNYINVNETDFVSFDHYPLKDNEPFKADFFYNMKVFKDKLGNSRPFWFVVQSHNGVHGNFTTAPYEPKLKFITSSAVAYGAKGLLYWSYMNGIEEYSSTYISVQKVNKYLKDVIGPIIMTSDYITTLHKSDTYMNQGRPFAVDELVDFNTTGLIKNVNNDNILLALYQKPVVNNTEYYIWVVNKDLSSNAQTVLTVNGSYGASISPRVDTYTSNNTFSLIPSQFTPSTNETTINIPELSPGEGVMIRLFKKKSLPIITDVEIINSEQKKDNNKTSEDYFKIYPNPTNNFINIKTKDEIISIAVYNKFGLQVIDLKTNSEKIDISNIPSGAYILEVKTKKSTISKNFIKN